MSDFMRKLQLSGYSHRTRTNILECAVNTYRKKLKAQDLGIQPIHRRDITWPVEKGRTYWASLHGIRARPDTGRKYCRKRRTRQVPQAQDHAKVPGQPSNRGQKVVTPDPPPHQPSTTQQQHQTTSNTSNTTKRTNHIEGILFVPHTPGGHLQQECNKQRTTSINFMGSLE